MSIGQTMESKTKTATSNPYEPPDSPVEATPVIERKTSILRGVLYALPSSAFGFLVPYFALGALPLIRFAFFGYSAVDRDADLRELPEKALIAAIGCALVFALAAIVNYSPAWDRGFLRTLALVGLSALLGLVVMGIARLFFNLDSSRLRPFDAYFVVRCAIAVSVPVMVSILMLLGAISSTNDRSSGN